MHDVVVVVRALEEGLGGDATDVEAGTPEGAARFYTGGFQAELGCFNGGDVASGTAADYNNVWGGEVMYTNCMGEKGLIVWVWMSLEGLRGVESKGMRLWYLFEVLL